MPQRIAQPGERACPNEECGWTGLAVAAGEQTCALCRTPIAQVPERSATPPAARVAQPAPAPGGVNGKRLLIAVVAAAVVVLVGVVVNNPDILHRVTGSEYKVGDCVTVRTSVLHGADMNRTDCRPNKFTGDPADVVYRVDAVKPGKNATCPGGPSRVTFSNEPENTTYCLTMTPFG